MSASETNAAVVNGDLSPVEVVQAYLDRIDRFDSGLNAYITVCSEEALAAADHQERQLDDGTASGPLFGVPIAVKDQFWTDGILTTNGSRVYRDFVPLRRRHGHLQAAGRRGDIARKIEPERVGNGRYPGPSVGHSSKPLGPGTHPRRVKRGLRRRPLGPPLRRVGRGRHRWLGTRPRLLLRRGGSSANLYKGKPLRNDPNVLVYGRRRANDQNGPRLPPWS